jgi:hypothetical protein
VIQAPIDGQDLIIRSDDGKQATIGTGPGYMAAMGFTLQTGEKVQVYGFWEDGEFKAAQVMRLHDGQSISLRDELGRPAWAGRGRRAGQADLGGRP